MARLTRGEACAILSRLGIHRGEDANVLPTSKLVDLADEARRVGYRKPKFANASRGVYFHNHLQRKCR
jgi:hypothetical protein